MQAIAHPIPPVTVTTAPCQEVVITGDGLKAPGGLAALPVPVSTPGFDSAPYLTATLCITRDPDSGVQNMGTYRAALKAADRLAVRMVAREATRRWRLPALAQISRPRREDADRDRHRRGAGRGFHGSAETGHRSGRACCRGRSRGRADPDREGQDRRSRRAGRC